MVQTKTNKMKEVNIKVSFSEDVFLAMRSAGFSEEKVRVEIKRSLALDLLKKGVLSFGKAASLADMCKSDFMDLLNQEGIPFHYGVEALERDIETVGKLSKDM